MGLCFIVQSNAMSCLGDIGEDALVKRLIEQLGDECAKDESIILGPGDDCAVVDLGQRGPCDHRDSISCSKRTRWLRAFTIWQAHLQLK